jgi:hypothetical protein
LSVAGCDKPPATPSPHEFAKEESTPDSLPSEVSSAPVEVTSQSPSPQPVATQGAIGFQKPAANEAWNQYVDNLAAVKSLPPPQVQDPLNNPSEITGYLNQVGSRLQALQESRDTVEANLSSPEEKKRFRAAEKSLLESQDQ